MALYDIIAKLFYIKPGTGAKTPAQSYHMGAPAYDAKPSDMRQAKGTTGLVEYGGYVYEEFLKELQGERGRKLYREMKDNDPTVGAILSAISLICLATKLETEPAPEDVTGEYADFVDGLFEDMGCTWQEALGEILTMLAYGFSVHEIVLKYRDGKNSKFNDGRIGISKLAPRSQDTILRWDFDDEGNLLGCWQDAWISNAAVPSVYLPRAKFLLFRARTEKENPEGRSILRNAYIPYYFLKKLQLIEAIAVERELNGIPVVKIPSRDMEDANKVAVYQKIASDLKMNSQGGLVIPSDPYTDTAGNPTSMPKVSVELLSNGGTRSIEPDIPIQRYQKDITRTVLADFLMLGSGDVGSFALSQDKTSLFFRSVESVMTSILTEMNEKLLPLIWRLNMLPMEMMPKLRYGQVAPTNIEQLGNYVSSLAAAGIMVADPTTEQYLRRQANLPQMEEGLPVVGDMDETALQVTNTPNEQQEENATQNQVVQPPSALNGAQMQALQQIAQSVADGQLPAQTAINLILLSIPSLSEESARLIITPAEKFTPEDKTA
jgi:hypothetical protein